MTFCDPDLVAWLTLFSQETGIVVDVVVTWSKGKEEEQKRKEAKTMTCTWGFRRAIRDPGSGLLQASSREMVPSCTPDYGSLTTAKCLNLL